MAVIDFGIIVNGIPVFNLDWRLKSKNESDNVLLRTGFMSAIQSFASDAFGDVMDTLTLKNMKIFFHHIIKTQEKEHLELILYAVSDQDTKSPKAVKKALIKCGNAISSSKNEISTLEPDKNTFIIDIAEKEFKKVRLRPEDRAQSLFW